MLQIAAMHHDFASFELCHVLNWIVYCNVSLNLSVSQSVTLTHFPQHESTFIPLNHFHLLKSTFIKFHPLSSTFIKFHQLQYSFIHFHVLSYTFSPYHQSVSLQESTTLLQLQTIAGVVVFVCYHPVSQNLDITALNETGGTMTIDH